MHYKNICITCFVFLHLTCSNEKAVFTSSPKKKKEKRAAKLLYFSTGGTYYTISSWCPTCRFVFGIHFFQFLLSDGYWDGMGSGERGSGERRGRGWGLGRGVGRRYACDHGHVVSYQNISLLLSSSSLLRKKWLLWNIIQKSRKPFDE